MSGVEDEDSWTLSYISSDKDMEFAYDKDAKTISRCSSPNSHLWYATARRPAYLGTT